jgi:putative ABC transport system ATP-binding protein
VLEARGLVKHYTSEGGEVVRAIDGVELRVDRGEVVMLRGPSGSGKTTLLELIAGVQVPDRGAVLVEGREVAKMTRAELDEYRMRKLGVVPESLQLIAGLTALDLAAFRLTEQGASWREAHRRVLPLLSQLGLRNRVDHQAGQLSKGQRQRVAIAMALATDPSAVLADEPTGNLDSALGRKVLRLLADYCHEHRAALLLVTHDPQAEEFADRVVELQDGRLEAAQAVGP